MAQTLEHLARKLKVSRRTVSRAISGHPYVSENKRNRILKYVEKYKFYKNRNASSLVSRRVHVLGLLFPKNADSESNHYVAEVIKGVTHAAKFKGFQVMCQAQSPYDYDACLEWVRSKAVGGILMVAPSAECEPMIRALLKEGVPLTVLNAQYRAVDSFTCDNFAGGMAATRHLIETGKKKIAFLHGHPSWMDPEERFRGYRQALKDAGLEINEEWVAHAYFESGAAEQCVDRLLSLRVRPDAIFAANDHMAIGAIHAIKKRKIKIPEEIAVIGFDDLPVCSFSLLEPTISSVTQPFEAMAKAASARLIDKISLQGKPAARNGGGQIFEAHLAPRGSTLAGYIPPVRGKIPETSVQLFNLS